MRRLDDPDEVEAQYNNSANFDARVRIYPLYAQNPQPLTEWVFDRLALDARDSVLEVGCGTGNVWRDNAARLPEKLDLTLSDLSQGMLREARQRLEACDVAARFEIADAQQLPFDSKAYDLVVANHMLYHVPDRPAALSELARVVAPIGRCIIVTNDWPHLIELRELLERFEVRTMMRGVGREPGFFDAETAAEEISVCFKSVRCHRYRDFLEVTDADVLADYVRSLAPAAGHDPDGYERLHEHVAEQISRLGSFSISTSVVLFEARHEPSSR